MPGASLGSGMLGMGHFEAAGNFDHNTDNTETHSSMTAARAFATARKLSSTSASTNSACIAR
jgi:hypothetical protein